MELSTLVTINAIKKHFGFLKPIQESKNENITKLLNDDAFIEQFKKIYAQDFCKLGNIKLDEDIMSDVLACHGSSTGEKIYIDEGTWLSITTDPRWLHSMGRRIRKSDIEYVKSILEENSNPLIHYSINPCYYELIGGHIVNETTEDNSTIIKPPSLISIENNLSSYEDEIKTKDWKSIGYATYDEHDDHSILRAQFYLKLINEDPEEVLEYYKDSNNWMEIEENVKKYAAKSKSINDEVRSKLKKSL